MKNNNRREPEQDKLREHIFDGIQEYDNRLPNWWLWTLYGAIIFAFAYWFFSHQAGQDYTAEAQLNKDLAMLTARVASLSKGPLSDEQMWALSVEPGTVADGAQVFKTNCVTCHGENLQGKIGPSLVDQKWIHGGQPTQIVQTITKGVATKGMPTWGPLLGAKRINNVAAYVLSFHKKGEPILPP
jgi:cytochrome c oxidase cbb3-type subunit 3